MAAGFVGLREHVLGVNGSAGFVAGPTPPELIPGLQAGAPGFNGGAAFRPFARAQGPASTATSAPAPRSAPPRVTVRAPRSGGPSFVVAVRGGSEVALPAPQSHAALRDTDRDGLPDAVERRLGTDPQRADTDGARMPHGSEARYHLNARSDLDATTDPDRDGVDNVNEFRTGTDPRVADTDHDGIPDGRDDSDHDGLPNAVEQELGLDPSRSSTPPLDRDFARTARNVQAPAPTADVQAASDPAVQPATVGDKPTDGALDSDGDGIPNALEVRMGLDPTRADTDGDGTGDGAEDDDGDGLPDALELRLGLDPTKADSLGDGTGDGRRDSDGDGLANSVELALGLDPAKVDTDGNGVADGLEDTDGDGMGNLDETAAGRDPATPDPAATPALEPPPAVTPAPVAPAPPADPSPPPPA